MKPIMFLDSKLTSGWLKQQDLTLILFSSNSELEISNIRPEHSN